jgi:hypothetical protein
MKKPKVKPIEIKRKSWILNLTTDPNRFLTIWPDIYGSRAYFECPTDPKWLPMIAHERVHLERQGDRRKSLVWLARWRWDATFRLDEEAIAIAQEVITSPEPLRESLIASYARQLAGPEYYNAAKTPAIAEANIRYRISCIKVPGSDTSGT